MTCEVHHHGMPGVLLCWQYVGKGSGRATFEARAVVLLFLSCLVAQLPSHGSVAMVSLVYLQYHLFHVGLGSFVRGT